MAPTSNEVALMILGQTFEKRISCSTAERVTLRYTEDTTLFSIRLFFVMEKMVTASLSLDESQSL
jgi:hypothetical protein